MKKKGLTLVGLDTNEANGLDFSFTHGAAEFSWRFDEASLLEFYALLLKGRMNDGRIVVENARVFLAPSAETQETHLVMTMGGIEIAVPFGQERLQVLADMIEAQLT